MAVNNLLWATTPLRNSVTNLKKKVTHVKNALENVSSELETLDLKLDKLITESEIYRAKVEREVGREVRRLEREL